MKFTLNDYDATRYNPIIIGSVAARGNQIKYYKNSTLLRTVTQGIGLSFEFAVPDNTVNYFLGNKTDYNGFGLDFGLVFDSDGIGTYHTTKTTKESAFSISAQVELFVAAPITNPWSTNLKKNILDGRGVEAGGSLLFLGASYGTYNSLEEKRRPSQFGIFTISLGVGTDVGAATWKTNTVVSDKKE